MGLRVPKPLSNKSPPFGLPGKWPSKMAKIGPKMMVLGHLWPYLGLKLNFFAYLTCTYHVQTRSKTKISIWLQMAILKKLGLVAL